MKIYNQAKTEILVDPDLTLGYLVEDQLIIHHDAVQGVEEQGHYEIVKEYPNGGKDAVWVVDTPEVEAKDAYDEAEDILVYIEYTKKELLNIQLDQLAIEYQTEVAKLTAQKDEELATNTALNEAKDRVTSAKNILASTDYKILKYIEGYQYSEEEFTQIKEERAAMRESVNTYEPIYSDELNKLTYKYSQLFSDLENEYKAKQAAIQTEIDTLEE